MKRQKKEALNKKNAEQVDDKCRCLCKDSKIKVEENGRQAVFLNKVREPYIRTKVDGCLLHNTIASDWVVSKYKCGDVIVELKGADVNHAVEQVVATAEYWELHELRNGKLAGLIVCSKYPRFDTKVQRAQQKFATKYKAPLHVVTKNSEYMFADVFTFGKY
jgi:hypothetical protein